MNARHPAAALACVVVAILTDYSYAGTVPALPPPSDPWSTLAEIATCVLAVLAFASFWALLWYSKQTPRTVNAQTEISRRQFEMAMRRQEEPDLTATPIRFEPFREDDGNGWLTVRVHNCGLIPLRKLVVTILIAMQKIRLDGPLSLSSGRAENARGLLFLSPKLSPLSAEVLCEFETPDGRRFQKRDRWNLSHSNASGHHLVSSEPVEEIEL